MCILKLLNWTKAAGQRLQTWDLSLEKGVAEVLADVKTVVFFGAGRLPAGVVLVKVDALARFCNNTDMCPCFQIYHKTTM